VEPLPPTDFFLWCMDFRNNCPMSIPAAYRGISVAPPRHLPVLWYFAAIGRCFRVPYSDREPAAKFFANTIPNSNPPTYSPSCSPDRPEFFFPRSPQIIPIQACFVLRRFRLLPIPPSPFGTVQSLVTFDIAQFSEGGDLFLTPSFL